MPRAFLLSNVLSLVPSTLIALWNPRSHIYGVRRLLVSPCSTARSRSYGSYFPSGMNGKITTLFLLLYKESLRLAEVHLRILDI